MAGGASVRRGAGRVRGSLSETASRSGGLVAPAHHAQRGQLLPALLHPLTVHHVHQTDAQRDGSPHCLGSIGCRTGVSARTGRNCGVLLGPVAVVAGRQAHTRRVSTDQLTRASDLQPHEPQCGIGLSGCARHVDLCCRRRSSDASVAGSLVPRPVLSREFTRTDERLSGCLAANPTPSLGLGSVCLVSMRVRSEAACQRRSRP